jgi:hypothetical protein
LRGGAGCGYKKKFGRGYPPRPAPQFTTKTKKKTLASHIFSRLQAPAALASHPLKLSSLLLTSSSQISLLTFTIAGAAEEMSLRHLNRLKWLLLKTDEYSSRNNLGDGEDGQVRRGLLDPLDGNLRREMVKYSEFIQAAYHSFHSDPAMSAQEPQTIWFCFSFIFVQLKQFLC